MKGVEGGEMSHARSMPFGNCSMHGFKQDPRCTKIHQKPPGIEDHMDAKVIQR